jgi:ankyrin repeat protein
VVTALLRLSPATARTRGPHNYPLLYHAGYSGDVAMGEAIAAQLSVRTTDFNQALQTATPRGHTDFVAWLLKNGVTDPNTKNFQKKTPLDLAVENGHEAIAKLLRENGGATGG